jgi:hypothetical protein
MKTLFDWLITRVSKEKSFSLEKSCHPDLHLDLHPALHLDIHPDLQVLLVPQVQGKDALWDSKTLTSKRSSLM